MSMDSITEVFYHLNKMSIATRDGPNVRLWHSAEAEGFDRLTERVPNVRPNVVC